MTTTEVPVTGRTLLTRTEAAELCGVSVDTIKRDQRNGAYPNAVRNDDGWRIPAVDLVSAGRLDPAVLATVDQTLSSMRESRQVRELLDQVAALTGELATQQALVAQLTGQVTFLQESSTSLVDVLGRLLGVRS